jgi:hypothetical protein
VEYLRAPHALFIKKRVWLITHGIAVLVLPTPLLMPPQLMTVVVDVPPTVLPGVVVPVAVTPVVLLVAAAVPGKLAGPVVAPLQSR